MFKTWTTQLNKDMKLKKPIIVQPPPFTRTDGTIKEFPPITIHDLDIMFLDFATKKYVTAKIMPCPKTITLWTDEEYDKIGDWTQKQAEQRVLEILGDEPKKVLESLFW